MEWNEMEASSSQHIEKQQSFKMWMTMKTTEEERKKVQETEEKRKKKHGTRKKEKKKKDSTFDGKYRLLAIHKLTCTRANFCAKTNQQHRKCSFK